MKDLKPCPFCGSKAIFETHGEKLPNFGIAVRCSNILECGCRFEFFDTKEWAIKTWNRRADNG